MKEQPIRHVFGERIRQLRTDQGLSQEQLAELADLHRTFIGRIERGETNVTLENIKKLSKGLNVSISKLFDGPVKKTGQSK
jgi:transcriptional regulator with XRE-family HTH domain